MERDYGIRFSSESYLSKEDIKKSMNLTSVDYIWDSVIKYRSLYSQVLDIFSIDKKPYSICYTSGITNLIIKYEKKLNKLEMKALKHDYQTVKNHFAFEILSTLALVNQMNDISSTIIESIVLNSLNVIPQKYVILHNYLACLNDIEFKNAAQLSILTIKRLYSLLLNGNASKIDDINDVYRKFELETKEEGIYIGAPCENIPDLMNSFIDVINDLDTFSLATASFVFYYINYIKPFEYFNEEMSLLLSKYILNHDGNNASFIPLESILLSLQNHELKKVFFECSSTLDLTYIFVKYMDVFKSAIQDVEIYYQNLDEMMIAKESLKEDNIYDFVDDEEEIKEEIIRKPEVKISSNDEVVGVNFERKVSLPTIPSGLSENDASLIADHLLELCPTLKRGQAEFYARHCTIGKYYTIQQYKNFNNVAYETARTSMDNLVLLEFYKKEKIRNKFVYTPVIR